MDDGKSGVHNEPVNDIMSFAEGKKVLFVCGGESARHNGCYEDVKNAVSAGKGEFFELDGASRELKNIERGLKLVKRHGIEMIIGASGASIMDCAKLIAFGAFHTKDLWDYVKGKKNPYGEKITADPDTHISLQRFQIRIRGSISESAGMMRELFEQIGVDMYFDGELSQEAVSQVATDSCLSQDELYEVLRECMR